MIDRDMMRPAQIEIEAAMRHLRLAAQAIADSEDHPSMKYADAGMRKRYEALFDKCMDALPVVNSIQSEMSCLMGLGV